MTVGVSIDAKTAAPMALEPSVAAARSQLAMRVRVLLLEHGVLEPQEIADRLGTTTAHVMFAVRELEQLGMVVVENPAP